MSEYFLPQGEPRDLHDSVFFSACVVGQERSTTTNRLLATELGIDVAVFDMNKLINDSPELGEAILNLQLSAPINPPGISMSILNYLLLEGASVTEDGLMIPGIINPQTGETASITELVLYSNEPVFGNVSPGEVGVVMKHLNRIAGGASFADIPFKVSVVFGDSGQRFGAIEEYVRALRR